MSRRSYRPAGGARHFPRTARLNQLLREIVADEIERIDDDRLGFLTVVDVTVDGDLRHATVWYTTLSVDESDPTVIEALAQHRPRIQAAIGRQARIRRTPELTFEPDAVVRQAERVEGILRDLAADRDEES